MAAAARARAAGERRARTALLSGRRLTHVLEDEVDVAVVLGADDVDEADDVVVARQLLRAARRRAAARAVEGARAAGLRGGPACPLPPRARARAPEAAAPLTCRYMTSRNVRCASVALRKASKHFFSATGCRERRSSAFQTMPYACARGRWRGATAAAPPRRAAHARPCPAWR